ncbi:MAG TPA: hypothetical protein VGA69_10890 [Nitriliruptorales bacterium]
MIIDQQADQSEAVPGLDAAGEKVNRIRPELEDLRRNIVSASTTWLVTWWDGQVRSAIENEPWLVLDELGEAGVTDLKLRVQQLEDRASELVKQRLGRSDLWVHRTSLDELIQLARAGLEAFERPYYLSGHGVQKVEEVLRQLAGELGPLLVGARLARYHHGGDPSGGAWRRPEQDGPRYMKTLDYPVALVRAMETYAHHVSTLFIAVRELDDLRRAHARSQAVQMWERA